MIEYLKALTKERTDLTDFAMRMADGAAADGRDLTDTEQAQLAETQQRCATIDAQLVKFADDVENTRGFARLLDRIEASTEDRTPATRNGSTSSGPALGLETTSWGAAFAASDAFRDYTGHGQSGIVEVGGFFEQRAAILTSALPIPHFVLPPVEYVTRAPLLEVCAHITVSSGVVDWVEVGGDPLAAVVAEGAAKPEAAMPLTPKTAALDTIAHWVQITRQALDDAPYVQSLIEQKLRRGLLNKAETDMAAAIDANASVQTATSSLAAGGSLLAAIRVGIGKVEATGYQPNAVALNPADYAALDVDVMGKTDVGPVRSATFWGLTPVAAAAIPAGKAYVGDFVAGATLFDRGVTSVFVTDSHASLFISNILVILAEARLKSAVTAPLALCECSTVA